MECSVRSPQRKRRRVHIRHDRYDSQWTTVFQTSVLTVAQRYGLSRVSKKFDKLSKQYRFCHITSNLFFTQLLKYMYFKTDTGWPSPIQWVEEQAINMISQFVEKCNAREIIELDLTRHIPWRSWYNLNMFKDKARRMNSLHKLTVHTINSDFVDTFGESHSLCDLKVDFWCGHYASLAMPSVKSLSINSLFTINQISSFPNLEDVMIKGFDIELLCGHFSALAIAA